MSHSLQPPPAETREEILLYPSEDGIPLESDNHLRGMINLLEGARDFCEDHGLPILAGANLFIYYVEGDPKKCVGPDFFVARDLSRTPRRRVYKVWIEGKMPELVVELASPSSARVDLRRKKDLYESLGVLEYLVFDGEGIGWDPPLVAFRRRGQRLEEESVVQPDGSIAFRSGVLPLEFRPSGEFLRFFDPQTGAFVPTRKERAATAERERERADAERERADAERERAERLAIEVARLRALAAERDGGDQETDPS